MVSEGSCDTEDWSSDAENIAYSCAGNIGINYIFNIVIRFLNITVFTICDPGPQNQS